jgi:heme-degrading monooxygenase HmoA
MYTVIRKYDIVPGMVEEFIQQVQKSLVPIINQVPGFREYSLMEVGENEVAAISIFESLDDAKVSAQQTAAWIAEHTELFIQGFTKLMAGNVRAYSGPIFLPEPKSVHNELLQGVF